MEIIKNLVHIPTYKSKVFEEYFHGLSLCVMDIETTGLYPASSETILGGLLFIEPNKEGKCQVIQYFSENKNSEKEMLDAYLSALSTADVLITYNGAGFDLPFLNYRGKKNKLQWDLDSLQSLDLYRALHHHSKLRNVLPNLKQKTVEAFLGLSSSREDMISGRESVELYEQYLNTGSKSAYDKILLHNRDDLVQLASLIKILDKLDLHKVLFHEGFTLASGKKSIVVKNISTKKSLITLLAKTKGIDIDYYSFEIGYQAVHKAKEKELTLTIPYEKKYDSEVLDLEAFNLDFTQVAQYPGYEGGYLILQENGQANYAEINKTLKVILTEILEKFVV